jgi:hypothetical protein
MWLLLLLHKQKTANCAPTVQAAAVNSCSQPPPLMHLLLLHNPSTAARTMAVQTAAAAPVAAPALSSCSAD